METEARELPQDYLNAFVDSIQKGFPVTYVEESQVLAVDHPVVGWIALQLKDKILVDNED